MTHHSRLTHDMYDTWHTYYRWHMSVTDISWQMDKCNTDKKLIQKAREGKTDKWIQDTAWRRKTDKWIQDTAWRRKNWQMDTRHSLEKEKLTNGYKTQLGEGKLTNGYKTQLGERQHWQMDTEHSLAKGNYDTWIETYLDVTTFPTNIVLVDWDVPRSLDCAGDDTLANRWRHVSVMDLTFLASSSSRNNISFFLDSLWRAAWRSAFCCSNCFRVSSNSDCDRHKSRQHEHNSHTQPAQNI